MSTCISRAGEYSGHETGDGQHICDRCGVLDEAGLFAERDALRARVARVEALLPVLDKFAETTALDHVGPRQPIFTAFAADLRAALAEPA